MCECEAMVVGICFHPGYPIMRHATNQSFNPRTPTHQKVTKPSKLHVTTVWKHRTLPQICFLGMIKKTHEPKLSVSYTDSVYNGSKHFHIQEEGLKIIISIKVN